MSFAPEFRKNSRHPPTQFDIPEWGGVFCPGSDLLSLADALRSPIVLNHYASTPFYEVMALTHCNSPELANKIIIDYMIFLSHVFVLSIDASL